MSDRLNQRVITLVLALTAATAGPELRAQSVSPLIIEYQERASGQLEIFNDTLYAMNVVLEAFSFRVKETGEPVYGPLDSEIQLQLSETGFRVGPRRRYTVAYNAKAEVLPAWFTIYATITRAGERPDVQVAFQLPHTVYLLPKRPLEREAVYFRRAEAGKDNSIEVEVENQSGQFGRVQEVELVSSKGKRTYPGFPFFPHQRRILSLESEAGALLERVVLKFPRFKVEQAISRASSLP